jgi:hypothetical protein
VVGVNQVGKSYVRRCEGRFEVVGADAEDDKDADGVQHSKEADACEREGWKESEDGRSDEGQGEY